MFKAIKRRIMFWLGRKGADELARRIPAELADLAERHADRPGILAGVQCLREVLDPEMRTNATSYALCQLCDAMERGTDKTPGELDDLAVMLCRGALNTLPPKR